MKVRLVYSGRGYDAVAKLPAEIPLTDGDDIDQLIAAVNQLLPDDRPLPRSAVVAVAGRHLGTVGQHAPQALREGDEVVIVAPVAGG